MKKKLITFDLDNTLWHVDATIVRANEKKFTWLKEHYPEIPEKLDDKDFHRIRNEIISHDPSIIIDLSELRIRSIEKAAQETGFNAKEARQIGEQAFEIFFEERNKVELFPHAGRILSELSQSFNLIALSNGNADLKIIGIAQYFIAHYKPTDVGAAKPDPHMFLEALKTANAQAEESIHVGDDLVCDIDAAKQLNFKTVFSNILEKESPESIALADATITSLDELPAAIENLLRP